VVPGFDIYLLISLHALAGCDDSLV